MVGCIPKRLQHAAAYMHGLFSSSKPPTKVLPPINIATTISTSPTVKYPPENGSEYSDTCNCCSLGGEKTNYFAIQKWQLVVVITQMARSLIHLELQNCAYVSSVFVPAATVARDVVDLSPVLNECSTW